MPEISRFYGIVIRMFYDEHNPPHFHAQYGEFNAVLKINDYALLEGYLPPKALGLVTEWASIHREELLKDWDLARENNELFKIEPLK
jgi:phosphomannomutase